MKKLLGIFVLVIVATGASIFTSRSYYPPLPIESVSKKEAIEKGNSRNADLVKLTDENGYAWYILNKQNTSEADEIIKEMVNPHGWTFIQKEGSGLFFEKKDASLIVSTQQWTGNWLLVKIPAAFDT